MRDITALTVLLVIVCCPNAGIPQEAPDRCFTDKTDAAADLCRALTERNPADARAYKFLGDALRRAQQYRESIVAFDKAVLLDPSYWNAYHNRGNSWYNLNQFTRAISDFSRAIKLNPSNSGSYHMRARARGDSGDLDGAIADATEAFRLAPDDDHAIYNRGNYWIEKWGLYDRGSDLQRREYLVKAVEDYTTTIKINPKRHDAHTNRGLAWIRLGEVGQALVDLNNGLSLNPYDIHAYNARGTIFVEKGDYDEAIADFNRALEIDESYETGYSNRGRAHLLRGDVDSAIADLTESIIRNPKNPYALATRGAAWRVKQQFEKSIADLKAALDLDSGYVFAKESLEITLERKRLSEIGSSSTSANQQWLGLGPLGIVQSIEVKSEILSRSSGGRRVALVIGNSAYRDGRLENPKRDAELVASILRQSGFDHVDLRFDLTRSDMRKALSKFRDLAASSEWATIYFAGHGLEIYGTNFMIPVDAKISSITEVPNEAVNLEYFLLSVEAAAKVRLVILDACRDNPFVANIRVRGLRAASRSMDTVAAVASISRGLARVEPQPGTLVVFSAKSGQYASDGDGENSPFALALAKRMEQLPPLEVRRLFDFVREDVFEQTRTTQQPFAYGNLRAAEDFFFRPPEKN